MANSICCCVCRIVHVVRRHVADQRHQRVVVVLHREVELVLGGDHRAAEAAPEVQFPGQAEPVVPLIAEFGLGMGRFGFVDDSTRW